MVIRQADLSASTRTVAQPASVPSVAPLQLTRSLLPPTVSVAFSAEPASLPSTATTPNSVDLYLSKKHADSSVLLRGVPHDHAWLLSAASPQMGPRGAAVGR
jgi:hypothetical protein